ncbi:MULTISPECIES: agarase [unclassified Shewanella]|uniref:agarase n=1 Tax=unclassified Shewanella TaxID=196818 RepID=UPI00354D7CAF
MSGVTQLLPKSMIALLVGAVIGGCSVDKEPDSLITSSDTSTIKESSTKETNSILQQNSKASSVNNSFSDSVLASIKLKNAVASTKIIDGKSQLVIKLKSKSNHTAGFSFKPNTPWDWSEQEQFAFALNLTNPLPRSTHIYVSVTDSEGKGHHRSFVLPANSHDTYYMELRGPDLNVETGLRANPTQWDSTYTPIIWRHGVKNIDLSSVAQIEFSVHGVPEDKQILVDDIRLIDPNKVNQNYLANLVDKFGQNTSLDFVNKVSSPEELVSISNQEQAKLSHVPPAGRSKFNGWKDGPKLKATGYFRVEKYQDKWSLVDPEGYLFFSTGIANIRMANTSTITGYDFDSQYITPRSKGDFTPEDSIGLNRAPKAAWSSRYVSSELRAKMFTWLPEYGEPMSSHFGYRREVHTGAVDKGETFSFYQANLARKYQTDDTNEIMEKWRNTTIDRMLTWGFTSFGNWVDASFYQADRIPYFANGWIIGDFKTVSSGNDYWSPLPDPFDPVFKQRALFTAKQIAAEVQNNPWCVGVFIDNEKSWGVEGDVQSHYGIAINTLNRDASESPTKAEFVKILKNQYANIDELNSQWGTAIDSWDSLSKGVVISDFNDAVVKDLSTLLEHYASEYFAVVSGAVKQYLPNHMYLGARFANWGMTPEVRSAAAKYADVMSYNYYKESINDSFWAFLEDIDKPSIIGEFHNGALDSGLINPGLIHAESQQDRGLKYQDYMLSVIDNPYFVGAHWFQYIDSPLTGRAYDGENYNVGFVSVTDIPYQPLVDAAAEVNKQIYTRRYDAKSQ